MKKLKKVKKHWIAVSIAAAFLFVSVPVSANASELTSASSQADSASVNYQETVSEQANESSSESEITAEADSTVMTTDETASSELLPEEERTNSVYESGSSLSATETAEINQTAPSSDESDALNQEIQNLQQVSAEGFSQQEVSSENTDTKITDDVRYVSEQPQVAGCDYTVHYDAENQWYYLDAVDFGLDVTGQTDGTAAVQKALETANAIVMQDDKGTRYTGVAVKLSGIVFIERDTSKLNADHYQLNYGNSAVISSQPEEMLQATEEAARETLSQDNSDIKSVPFYTEEGLNKLQTLANFYASGGSFENISEEQYHNLLGQGLFDDDGVTISIEGRRLYKDGHIEYDTAYTNSSASLQYQLQHIEAQTLNQIKIDQSLSHVTALYGDGQGSTTIKTNLCQTGEWNSTYNNTDARDHAVILADGLNGFTIKDITIAIEDVTGKEFYVSGNPYYGKVFGLQVNDSSNVTVQGIEVYGANRAGLAFTSTNNSVPKTANQPETSLSQQAQASGKYSSLILSENNKILNNNLHHNRVAGALYSYQKNILIDGNTFSLNGAENSGGTGYGLASEAGSYNSGIIITNNHSSYNYRKGIDAHEGDHILIANNTSYGDRLLGISVYNRSFPMEFVAIKDNIIIQDPNNRLDYDDYTASSGSLLPAFQKQLDYVEYVGIFLQTNSQNLDLSGSLSQDGTKAFYDISNNTISGLAISDAPKEIQDYNRENGTTYSYQTRAILMRLQEPYLDYLLNVSGNFISGQSATGIIQAINSSIVHSDTRPVTNLAIGNGSGTILIDKNKAIIDQVISSVNGHAPITVTETSKLTKKTNGTNETIYQDTVRGSLIFTQNDFDFGFVRTVGRQALLNTKSGTVTGFYTNTTPLISVLTNAPHILFESNRLKLNQLSQTGVKNATAAESIFKINGMVKTNTAKPSEALTAANSTKSSERATSLYPQALVFLNNAIKLGGLSLAKEKEQFKVLSTATLTNFLNDNTVSDLSQDSALITEASANKSVYSIDREHMSPSAATGKQVVETIDYSQIYIPNDDKYVQEQTTLHSGKNGQATLAEYETVAENGTLIKGSETAGQTYRYFIPLQQTDALDGSTAIGTATIATSTEVRETDYQTIYLLDDGLLEGESVLLSEGHKGTIQLVYRYTYTTDGDTGTRRISKISLLETAELIASKPQLIAIGTQTAYLVKQENRYYSKSNISYSAAETADQVLSNTEPNNGIDRSYTEAANKEAPSALPLTGESDKPYLTAGLGILNLTAAISLAYRTKGKKDKKTKN